MYKAAGVRLATEVAAVGSNPACHACRLEVGAVYEKTAITVLLLTGEKPYLAVAYLATNDDQFYATGTGVGQRRQRKSPGWRFECR